MARSTGPILAIGAITLANQSLVHNQPVDWRIPVATGIAATMFALMESAPGIGPWAADLSWLALATVLFVRLNPNVPAPVESFLSWWQATQK